MQPVEARRRETGVRLAPGAARSQVVWMLLSSGGRGMLAGLGAGLLLSPGAGPVLGRYLCGPSPLDPLACAGVLARMGRRDRGSGHPRAGAARRGCQVNPAATLRVD